MFNQKKLRMSPAWISERAWTAFSPSTAERAPLSVWSPIPDKLTPVRADVSLCSAAALSRLYAIAVPMRPKDLLDAPANDFL